MVAANILRNVIKNYYPGERILNVFLHIAMFIFTYIFLFHGQRDLILSQKHEVEVRQPACNIPEVAISQCVNMI